MAAVPGVPISAPDPKPRLTGPVSTLPGAPAPRDLLGRAARAWSAQQEEERERLRQQALAARERQARGLADALWRILQVPLDPRRVRINADGYALATVDGLVFRASTFLDGFDTHYELMVLDAADNWHQVESLAHLGALDEGRELARLAR